MVRTAGWRCALASRGERGPRCAHCYISGAACLVRQHLRRRSCCHGADAARLPAQHLLRCAKGRCALLKTVTFGCAGAV